MISLLRCAAAFATVFLGLALSVFAVRNAEASWAWAFIAALIGSAIYTGVRALWLESDR